MLELRDIVFTVRDQLLLDRISFATPTGHFMAVVGPSGCGKSTLLKLIAGIVEESEGSFHWFGRNLAEDGDLEPSELGYVPQFSIASDHLTVEENVENAVQLRIATNGRGHMHNLADRILLESGLDEIRERRVAVLSGGQRRRLGLALELASDPQLLLCDEVTSGLDPRSEHEIVLLLHKLSRSGRRVVLNVTHSLSHLELYDSILVLYEGRLVYHGPPRTLQHYFSVADTEDIYPQLTTRDVEGWRQSWEKRRDSYYEKIGIPDARAELEQQRAEAALREEPQSALAGREGDPDSAFADEPAAETARYGERRRLPGPFTQMSVLLERRWKTFLRDRTQLLLHLAILAGFPILVVLFTPNLFDSSEPAGIPEMPKQTISSQIPSMQDVEKQAETVQEQLGIGGLISGMIMFQVVLLCLIGSNNAAREIASERRAFEKEKLAGLRTLSYLASKVLFLGVLVAIQALWMTFFVQYFANLPGDIVTRAVLLLLVNGAMTAVCLGISALMRSPEQASLLCIYLVGFQLPLSGAVLALPDVIGRITRPFISAYWSWAGQLRSMTDTPHYVGIKAASPTELAEVHLCCYVLAVHLVIGCAVAYIGCRRHLWD
ncbi:MAG TPA: ATP-binding cassette domain-containing protein [Verrucomicrobiales bacterium]|nr:ATP-binding cassette domain-containing protein [Verrucomicrobiales bacterium]